MRHFFFGMSLYLSIHILILTIMTNKEIDFFLFVIITLNIFLTQILNFYKKLPFEMVLLHIPEDHTNQ